MNENDQVLNIQVRAGIKNTLDQFQDTLEALHNGKHTEPHFSVGFENVSQMLGIFTPKRWELLACLREQGAMTIAELARQLKRNYKNVHNDVERLTEWLAVEKNEAGEVFTPYSEVVVDIHLPSSKAA